MRRVIVTTLAILLVIPTAMAQRGNKGQHSVALRYGLNTPAEAAWAMGIEYNNYRKGGTIDAEFMYCYSEGYYKEHRAAIHNYMLCGSYSHRLLQNYRRTLMVYAGAGAAIGYTQGNNGDRELAPGISLKTTEELAYALVPSLRMDIFVAKNFGFTAKVQDLIFIHSDLMQPHNTTITIGFKYLIK